jgi:hypothetical protein
MTNSISPTDRLVDYLAGASDFYKVMSITVPDMKLRGKNSEWVLTNYLSRRSYMRGSHTVGSPYFRPQRPMQIVPADFRPQHELMIFKLTIGYMQDLHRTLHDIPSIPSTQVGRILRILMRHPVITVAQMSEAALVSDATAKRWLKAMCKEISEIRERPGRGVNVYVNNDLCMLINQYG